MHLRHHLATCRVRPEGDHIQRAIVLSSSSGFFLTSHAKCSKNETRMKIHNNLSQKVPRLSENNGSKDGTPASGARHRRKWQPTHATTARDSPLRRRSNSAGLCRYSAPLSVAAWTLMRRFVGAITGGNCAASREVGNARVSLSEICPLENCAYMAPLSQRAGAFAGESVSR